MRVVAIVGLALLAGVVAASLRAAPSAAPPTYFKDVKPVLEGRCGNCHMAGGIAPFSLQTYGQARRHRREISAAVRGRVMPPWHADRGFRRYLWDPSLSKAQISAISRWAAAGGPKGDPASAGDPLPPVGGGLTRSDVRLQLPTYTPRKSKRDDYRCFVVAWPDRPR